MAVIGQEGTFITVKKIYNHGLLLPWTIMDLGTSQVTFSDRTRVYICYLHVVTTMSQLNCFKKQINEKRMKKKLS